MRRVTTFNALHLGDNLVHLHFLRALALRHPEIEFVHGARPEYLGQLAPLTEGLPNLRLVDVESVGQGAINAWRGAGGHWYSHPLRADFVAYHLDWFRHLSRMIGVDTPFHCAADLLFDYPALRRPPAERFDVLLVNSAPQSGQWSRYDPRAWREFALRLVAAGHSVITTAATVRAIPCTRDTRLDVSAIGALSVHVRCIIGCVTGPMWPTLNVLNRHTVERIHLLDHERVDVIPEHTSHANDLSLVPELLRDRRLL